MGLDAGKIKNQKFLMRNLSMQIGLDNSYYFRYLGI